LLRKINVNVIAEQSRHSHLAYAFQLIVREPKVLVSCFVVEAVAELPIAKLLSNDAFSKMIELLANFVFF
jgi:hypothetical protein